MTYTPDNLTVKVDAGVRAGITASLEEHHRAGRSVVVFKSGRIVEVTSEMIPALIEEIQKAGLTQPPVQRGF